jgi:glutathionyl-hydroquinone reductase
MSEIQLYSAVLCPFAHRTRLALIEKGLPFKLVEIDLHNKPENFRDISPYGTGLSSGQYYLTTEDFNFLPDSID